MKLKTFTAAAIFTTFLTTAVSATPVTLEYKGYTGGKVSVTTSTVGPYSDRKVAAGALSMTDSTGPLGNFIAWCLDLTSYVGIGKQSYQITDKPFTNSYGLDGDQKGRIQSMFDANYNASVETDKAKAAGFQLALWEVLYDDDYSLSSRVSAGSDTFKGRGVGNSWREGRKITGFANDFLNTAKGFTNPAVYKLDFLQSDPVGRDGSRHNQNFVTVTPVPLPAAGLMMVLGLAGLGVAARRRKTIADTKQMC